jgi:hypothetical protein
MGDPYEGLALKQVHRAQSTDGSITMYAVSRKYSLLYHDRWKAGHQKFTRRLMEPTCKVVRYVPLAVGFMFPATVLPSYRMAW